MSKVDWATIIVTSDDNSKSAYIEYRSRNAFLMFFEGDDPREFQSFDEAFKLASEMVDA